MKTSTFKFPHSGIHCVVASAHGTLELPQYLDRAKVNAMKLPGVNPGQTYVWATVNDVLELWTQAEWQSQEASLRDQSTEMILSDTL